MRNMNKKARIHTQDEIPAGREIQARVMALYQQEKDAEAIAALLKLAPGTVRKILEKAEQGSRIVYVFADGTQPATIIDVRNFTRKVAIINLTDELTSRAFGVKTAPEWEDYEYFLESRCMPGTRYGIREELKSMGLDSYDPFQIIQKTRGRVYGDHQYLSRMLPEWIAGYDEILKNTVDDQERAGKLKKYLQKSERAWKLDESQY